MIDESSTVNSAPIYEIVLGELKRLNRFISITNLSKRFTFNKTTTKIYTIKFFMAGMAMRKRRYLWGNRKGCWLYKALPIDFDWDAWQEIQYLTLDMMRVMRWGKQFLRCPWCNEFILRNPEKKRYMTTIRCSTCKKLYYVGEEVE